MQPDRQVWKRGNSKVTNIQEHAAPQTVEAEKEQYLRAAETWETDIHRSLRRSRNLAWSVAGIAGGISALSLATLVLLLPLKQFEPYLVVVDKTSGYTEIARALKPGSMAENEAVTAANLVRYIKARETYDPRETKANFDLAQLYSAEQASKDLTWLWTPANTKSLDKIYGRNATRSVEVKSVSLLNKNTATVRFNTTLRRDTMLTTESWVAVIRFRYTSTPLKNEWRFDNPLGFQVTDYRRDQETAPVAGSLQ